MKPTYSLLTLFWSVETTKSCCLRISCSAQSPASQTNLISHDPTGWDAQIWLTLQAKWDLWHALKARGRRPKVRPLRKTA